jgi:SAM-dependent methyltransferase
METKPTCSCCSGKKTGTIELMQHWNKTYHKVETEKLGWYEEKPEASLRLIEKCNLNKDAAILNVGAGSTTMVDELLKLNYTKIIANDISSSAFDNLKKRLGNNNQVKYIIDDLTFPSELANLEQVDLWHDRAVLHFFNEKREQECYFDLLRKLVKKNGYVIIAVFNLNGATKCSGLPVHRYDESMLHLKLGPDFELIQAFNHTYTQPSGNTREFIYTLYKRIK